MHSWPTPSVPPVPGEAVVLRLYDTADQAVKAVDVTPDASPIVGATPYENLYLNCGWGTGGFKATPGVGWALAHTIATGSPHAVNAPFTLDRFVTGRLIDEHGAAAVAH